MARSGARAGLAVAVAVAVLSGLALVSTPGDQAAAPAGGVPGRPMGAISPPAPAADEATTRRSSAIAELLARRAAAVLNRDEQAFLATVDPTAEEFFRTTQRELFQNLAGVPLDEWSYTVNPEDTVDLTGLPDSATGAGTDRAAAELWAPAVDLHYALRGADLIPTSKPMGYLFARHGERWYLRSDTALGALGRRHWRGPWDFGRCVVTSTAHGIVLAHPNNEQMVERLAGELDGAVRAVSAVWGTRWPQRAALVLPDSLSEMRALVGPDFPVDSVVAVALADRVDVARHAAAGQRVVLNPTGARALSISSLRVVLRHELTHVATRADTVDGAPVWLLEGFADYVGYRDSGISLAQSAPNLAATVRSGAVPTQLPEDREFRASGGELDLAYQKGFSLARFIAERFGEARLVALYRALAGVGAISAGETDTLLRRQLGLDRSALVTEWQQYLRGTLR